MTRTQAHRDIELTTPLGTDVLLFRRMTATEELGRLFVYDLDLLSEDHNLQAEDILGQNVTIRLNLSAGGQRFFNGHVTRFAHVGHFEHFSTYEATVRPWFWFLTRTSDCRIFQDKTVPDIVKEVFRDNGYSDFDDLLTRNYRTWTYCVQYRETDFNFLSRLMEQEGFYYYFRHENDKHTLVLADSINAHDPIPNYESVPYYPPDADAIREDEYIFDWSDSKQIQPGTYVLEDYNFETPRADLKVQRTMPQSHTEAEREVFDYPGEYVQVGDGDEYVRTRIEELQAGYERIRAEGNTRGLFPGGLFTLRNNPREDQNREYLVVSAVHALELDAYGSSGSVGRGPVYDGSYTAIPSDVTYRCASITPKPVVQGPQTAVVVGPAGQEIYTDRYGRIKVQFHWDRYGARDENSSCWMRVSQPWAGQNWGAIAIPRIGQEVIVDFLEGDPDQPIVTGRVYNANQMPPYQLPDNATQSGVKSRSSKQGTPSNFNELRFEDKKGEEEVYFHAEKNFTRLVENNDTLSVGGSQSVSIRGDQTETIGNNRSCTVQKGDDKLEVETGNRSISVKGNHEVDVLQGSSRFDVHTGNHDQNVHGTMTFAAEHTELRARAYTLVWSIGHVEIDSPNFVDVHSKGAIELRVGSSSIRITTASIDIQAPVVNIKGMPVKINC